MKLTYKDFVALPLGLMLLSFALEFLKRKYTLIPTLMPQVLFWLSMVTLVILIVLKQGTWIKEFITEMRKPAQTEQKKPWEGKEERK